MDNVIEELHIRIIFIFQCRLFVFFRWMHLISSPFEFFNRRRDFPFERFVALIRQWDRFLAVEEGSHCRFVSRLTSRCHQLSSTAIWLQHYKMCWRISTGVSIAICFPLAQLHVSKLVLARYLCSFLGGKIVSKYHLLKVFFNMLAPLWKSYTFLHSWVAIDVRYVSEDDLPVLVY